MPDKLEAYKCAQCGKLIATTESHIHVTKLEAVWIPDDNASDHNKRNPKRLTFTDVVVCDSTCFENLTGFDKKVREDF